MKIIVAGAGQGGLAAAALLGKHYDVTVFEKEKDKYFGMDWFDGLSVKFFEDTGMAVPSRSFKGASPSFIGPGSKEKMWLRMPEKGMDWSVNRKEFTAQLIDEAQTSGAKFVFGAEVQGLIMRNNTVAGVKVNGEEYAADLVIDSLGMNSVLRAGLPVRSGIDAVIAPEDVFNVYRGVYNAVDGYPAPEGADRFKMYLKFTGRKSIAWCGVEPSGELNVLAGMIGDMTVNDFNAIYSSLKADNPVIATVKEGRSACCTIPVRYPLTMLCYPGYAVLGDAAFMTIPIMGSGIENSIRAGRMLACAILESGRADMDRLWKYQAEYYKTVGAGCFLLDWVKRGLLESDNADLKRFTESGLVTDADVYAVTSGKLPKHSVKEWTQKLIKLTAARGLLGGFAPYAAKGIRAMLTAQSIPKKYDPVKAGRWQYKAERSMDR